MVYPKPALSNHCRGNTQVARRQVVSEEKLEAGAPAMGMASRGQVGRPSFRSWIWNAVAGAALLSTTLLTPPLHAQSGGTAWPSRVPSLLPTNGNVADIPAWEDVSLSRAWSADRPGAGWRPVGSQVVGASDAGYREAVEKLRATTQLGEANPLGTDEPNSRTEVSRGTNSGQNSLGLSATSHVNSVGAGAEPWVQTVLAEGQALAGNDRWSEALSVYQTALRKAPDNKVILAQRQSARIQVDLRNRLADAKYLRYAQADSVDMALAHLNEILLKIELNHLATPNWNQIFQHGLQSLLVSFENTDFRNLLTPNLDENGIESLTQRLQSALAQVSLRHHGEMVGLVRELASELQRQWGIRPSVVIHEFAGSAASALDTYSSYLSPGQFDDLNSQVRGNFVGIGVELRSHENHLEIIKAIPGGPADQARIRGGDKILAVDDQAVSSLGGDTVADLLKGSEGSTVTVIVETPDSKQYRLRLQRARVDIPSIEDVRLVDDTNRVGYIKLVNFQKNTPLDFDRALQTLSQQGMQRLILDLRDNPGGAFDAAVAIADRFITQGTIVSTKGRSFGENMSYPAHAGGSLPQLPVVVLINENSASASEILAAAIADQKRGTIIGEKSFGKGVVQTFYPLTSGRGGIRLTTAEYFSPNGRRVERQGVEPDYVVQDTARPNLDGDGNAPTGDSVLEAAIRFISR